MSYVSLISKIEPLSNDHRLLALKGTLEIKFNCLVLQLKKMRPRKIKTLV